MEWYPTMLLKCHIVIGTFTFFLNNNIMIIPCIRAFTAVELKI